MMPLLIAVIGHFHRWSAMESADRHDVGGDGDQPDREADPGATPALRPMSGNPNGISR